MKLSRYYTAMDWEFGFGVAFYSEGKAIPGYWTIRPLTISFMFGPWTFEFERHGRLDIYSN